MECEFPAHNSTTQEIETILKSAKTIAVIGLSPDPEKTSHRVSAYLQLKGYKILPVHPKADTILNEKVYRSLADVPGPIDIVDVFRKQDALESVTEEVLKRDDVSTLWFQLGLCHNESAKKALDAGLQVVQNKCLLQEHQKVFS